MIRSKVHCKWGCNLAIGLQKSLKMLFLFTWLEHLVFTIVVIAIIHIFVNEGLTGLAKKLLQGLRSVPIFNSLILYILHSEVKSFTKQIQHDNKSEGKKQPRVVLPEKGRKPGWLIQSKFVLFSKGNPCTVKKMT